MILKLCLQASAYILFIYFFSLHFKLPIEHLHLAALQVPQTQGVKKQSQYHFPKVSQYLCCGYSAAQQCLTLCDLMDCSTPGFPVHQQLTELAQTHVH